MKIPWRNKNSKSSTTSSNQTSIMTRSVVDTCYYEDDGIGVGVDDVTTNTDNRTILKLSSTTTCAGGGTSSSTINTSTTTTTPDRLSAAITTTTTTTPPPIIKKTSSPMTLLGSGHYSPIDGTVSIFEPVVVMNVSSLILPQTTTTANETKDNFNTKLFLQPTSFVFEQRSSDDDDNDRYFTPLQNSMTSSCDETNISNSSRTNSFVPTVVVKVQHDCIPLTVAESNVTDTTTDTTVDADDIINTKQQQQDMGGENENIPFTTSIQVASSSSSQPQLPSSSLSTITQPPKMKESVLSTEQVVPTFLRHASSFLRVSDLIGMDPTMDLSEHSHNSIPNYHRCCNTPPPGIPHDPTEQWIALDDGCCNGDTSNTTNNMSSYTPIAQFAVDALATTALATIFDHTMWIPDAKTSKIIESKSSTTSWEATTFQQQQPLPITTTTTAQDKIPLLEDHILIWSGTFRHGLYGSEIPAIRSAAIIHMSSTNLLHLLMDSNRVKEYNTMSLGRTDILHLPCRNHIVTKVMRSESRPPLLRKTLQFTSIFHARKLNVNHNDENNDTATTTCCKEYMMENDSYLLVTRSVENPTTNTTNGTTSSIVVSEILLGVNVIRAIPHHPNACVLLSVNHVRSPLIPSLFLAKRFGLQAATNFVHDLRKCC